MQLNNKNKKGFTLIELLVVVAIIGILSSTILVSMQSARAKARDARRLQDMRQIVTALQLYWDRYERYPSISADACCDGWDQGPCEAEPTSPFIGALATDVLLQTPLDPVGGSGNGCYGYNYYRYAAGSYGCDASRGAYFVLGVRDMETSGRPHPSSPGWSCSGRNWQTEFDWVIGGFEKN
ncbi:MAG: type II secretion system protein [Candidatus Nealsonbacteria bacterium]|nr:type II secretion system protein [Candidatus Nealsonbacteria bacterium]